MTTITTLSHKYLLDLAFPNDSIDKALDRRFPSTFDSPEVANEIAKRLRSTQSVPYGLRRLIGVSLDQLTGEIKVREFRSQSCYDQVVKFWAERNPHLVWTIVNDYGILDEVVYNNDLVDDDE